MNSLDRLAKTLVEPLADKGTSPYETNATVIRLEDGMAWVRIPGGVEETPAVLAVSALPGDEVRVRVTGGKAYVTGNPSAPPTDDTLAQKAQDEAVDAAKAADEAATQAEDANRTATGAARDASVAKETAESSYHIAANTNQYFWHTESGEDTGAHITEIPREAFLLDPEHGGGNLLARSNGIAVREGLNELAVMSADGFDAKTYDSNGNEVVIAHLGYGPGTDSGGGTSDAPYYTIGKRSSNSTVGNYSVAEGYSTTASNYSSHAEGYATTASGYISHAEGYSTVAREQFSHAEGALTKARGYTSHAEGYNTTASGSRSHAEGYFTTASGDYSHAQNRHTVATETYQTAIGQYNAATRTGSGTSADPYVYSDAGNYAFIIGNGTGDDTASRSNALTVDWLGGIEMYLDHNGTSSSDATSGTDKDLFNAIRALGWYSDVIV